MIRSVAVCGLALAFVLLMVGATPSEAANTVTARARAAKRAQVLSAATVSEFKTAGSHKLLDTAVDGSKAVYFYTGFRITDQEITAAYKGLGLTPANVGDTFSKLKGTPYSGFDTSAAGRKNYKIAAPQGDQKTADDKEAARTLDFKHTLQSLYGKGDAKYVITHFGTVLARYDVESAAKQAYTVYWAGAADNDGAGGRHTEDRLIEAMTDFTTKQFDGFFGAGWRITKHEYVWVLDFFPCGDKDRDCDKKIAANDKLYGGTGSSTVLYVSSPKPSSVTGYKG